MRTRSATPRPEAHASHGGRGLARLVLALAGLAPAIAQAQTLTFTEADRSVYAEIRPPIMTQSSTSGGLGTFDQTAAVTRATATQVSHLEPRRIEVDARVEGKTIWSLSGFPPSPSYERVTVRSVHVSTFTLDVESAYRLSGRLRNYHGFFAYAPPAVVRLTGPDGVVFEVSHVAQGECTYVSSCEGNPWETADESGRLPPGEYTFEATVESEAYGYYAPVGLFDEACLGEIEVVLRVGELGVPAAGPFASAILMGLLAGAGALSLRWRATSRG